MFKRFVVRRNLLHLKKLSFGQAIFQNFKHDDSKFTLLGGGLEKLYGGIKEEMYFNRKDNELISKIRQDGSKVKGESKPANTEEFEKVIATGVSKTSLCDSCCPNKHKDCKEEAFFLTEQTDTLEIMKHKIATEKVTAAKIYATTKITRPSPDVIKPPIKKP